RIRVWRACRRLLFTGARPHRPVYRAGTAGRLAVADRLAGGLILANTLFLSSPSARQPINKSPFVIKKQSYAKLLFSRHKYILSRKKAWLAPAANCRRRHLPLTFFRSGDKSRIFSGGFFHGRHSANGDGPMAAHRGTGAGMAGRAPAIAAPAGNCTQCLCPSAAEQRHHRTCAAIL